MRRALSLMACIAFLAAGHAAEPAAAGLEMALVDMQGQKTVLGPVSDTTFAPRVSPDGKKVAFEMTDDELSKEFEAQIVRIFVAGLDSFDKPLGLQMTVIARRNMAPVWTPDGEWIAFLATGNGSDALFWERADGGIQPIYMLDGRAVEGFFGDHKMNFITLKGNRDYGISMFDTGTHKVTPLIDQPGSEQHSSEVSPDGKWIAYVSNESGRQEVWLEPMPLDGKRYQLTRNGGRHPQWSPDGRQIFFDQGGQVFRMPLTFGAEPRAGDPVALPIKGFVQGDLRRQYDLMPDGKGFVMLFPTGEAR
jgi:eukaryotic-like serine/threonine-protein kinase